MDVPSPATPQVDLVPVGTILPYRADLLLRATRQVPLTTEGLPVGYYRVDLLPNTKPETSQEELQALRNAYVELSYDHGYPTLPDGRPYWHKLDFEPGFAYGAFQIFIESIDKGPRELFAICNDLELRHLATKMYLSPQEAEALPGTDKLISKDRLHKIIHEFSVLYTWRPRAKAHDLYKDAAFRHVRLRRQMSVEDEHFTLAQRLKKQLLEKVMEQGDAFWEGMSAKTAVDFLGKLVAIERVSIGLPAQGPLSQKEQPEDMTFEMIMRTLGQKTAGANVYEHNGGMTPGRQILTDVLRDPQAAASMQEMIIRITRSTQQALPDPGVGTRAQSFKGRRRELQIINEDDLTAGLDISGAPGENLDMDSDAPVEPK